VQALGAPQTTFARLARALGPVACCLVAALFLVPSLRDATRTLSPSAAASAFRINRGVDAPKSRSEAAPPAEFAPAFSTPAPRRPTAPVYLPLHTAPLDPHTFVEDALRGPPRSL
jgi:hypothetical protein